MKFIFMDVKKFVSYSFDFQSKEFRKNSKSFLTIFIFYVFLKKYDLCHYKVDKKVTDNDNPVYKKQNKMENI